MGHASPRAALIYQHATRERDEAIAVALDVAIQSAVPVQRADEAAGADRAPIGHDTPWDSSVSSE